MADQQVIRRRAVGLHTHPNDLQLPAGALLRADNAVIDREGVIGKRRGFNRYGQALRMPASSIFEFKNRLIVHEGGNLRYDSDGLGTWIDWIGTFNPASSNQKIRGLETNGNVYFATFLGVWKNDALNGTPRRAGMPQGLDLQLAFITGGNGFMDPDTQIAYRIIWGREDASKNLITGTPSFRETIFNPAPASATATKSGNQITVTKTAHGYVSGEFVEISDVSDPLLENGQHQLGAVTANTFVYLVTDIATPLSPSPATLKIAKKQDVTITFTVPSDIVAGDFYEIYRTLQAPSASTDPGETFKRVKKATYVSGMTITYNDTSQDASLDLNLYTNDTEEGPNQTNDRPPHCISMLLYKGHVFYLFCKREESLTFQLDTAQSLLVNSSQIVVNTGSDVAYTFATAEDQALRKFKLFTTADPSSPTMAQVVEKTMKSFVKIVNRDSASQVNAFYISGGDDAPGKVELRQKTINSNPFTVRGVGIAGQFTPDILTAQSSSSDLQENVVYRSKFGQPEAVPRFNRHFLGRKNKFILGGDANREAAFILKEDGIFTISGETDGGAGFNFLVTEHDPTIILRGKETIVSLDNAVYAVTSQGGTRITQAGSAIFSRAIEIDLLGLMQNASFIQEAYAISYESERKYILIPKGGPIYVYNYITNAWCVWLLDVTCGLVLTAADKLYLAHGSEPYILEERKSLSYSGDDFQDESITGTISAVGSATVDLTYTYFKPLTAGWHLKQGLIEARILSVTTLSATSFRLALSGDYPFVAGAALVSQPIKVRIEWAPETAQSAGVIKQFSAVQVYQENEDGRTNRLGFLADHQEAYEFVADIVQPRSRGWGLDSWGSDPWGSPKRGRATPVKTAVPQNHQRARALQVAYENNVAKENIGIVELAFDLRPYGTRTQREPA